MPRKAGQNKKAVFNNNESQTSVTYNELLIDPNEVDEIVIVNPDSEEETKYVKNKARTVNPKRFEIRDERQFSTTNPISPLMAFEDLEWLGNDFVTSIENIRSKEKEVVQVDPMSVTGATVVANEKEKYLCETGNKLNNAYSEIAKLRNVISEMEKKHRSDLQFISVKDETKTNQEIEEMQDNLAIEKGRAESLKSSCAVLNQELKATTNNLLNIIQEEHERSKSLKDQIQITEKTRYEDLEKYNNKLKCIRKTLEDINDLNLTHMMSKIDYTSRESIWLVAQLGKLMTEKRNKVIQESSADAVKRIASETAEMIVKKSKVIQSSPSQ